MFTIVASTNATLAPIDAIASTARGRGPRCGDRPDIPSAGSDEGAASVPSTAPFAAAAGSLAAESLRGLAAGLTFTRSSPSPGRELSGEPSSVRR
jgi:hypothetical protein